MESFMELDEINSYSQLTEVIEEADWRSFEEIVGRVFELNGYEVEVSKVIQFEEAKRQYDVLAELEYSIIADCKKWDNKRKIKYGLKRAVEEQIERIKRLPDCKDKYPIIVLSGNTPIRFHNQVPIVSIYKLNEFLSDFQIHKENILKL